MIFNIILVVITIVTVHPSASHNHRQSHNHQNSVFHHIGNIVHNVIGDVRQKLSELFEGMCKKVGETVHSAKENFVEEVHDRISKVEEEAEELGIDIADCMEEREDYLKSLPKYYCDSVAHCGDNVITKGKLVMAEAEKNVTNATMQNVEKLKMEFHTCLENTTLIVCKARMGYQIGRTLAQMPVNIFRIVMNTTAPSIKSLLPDLHKCVIQQKKDFFKDLKTIFNDIKTCVKNETIQD